jgi:hypothetical protein
VRAELVDLRAHLEREVTAAKAAEETQNQPPPTALQGEGIAAAA